MRKRVGLAVGSLVGLVATLYVSLREVNRRLAVR